MATTTNRLSMLTMYFQQFQEKETSYKAKALIEERHWILHSEICAKPDLECGGCNK